MTRFVDHDDVDINELAQELMANWRGLKSVYRIPKRTVSEEIAFPPPFHVLTQCTGYSLPIPNVLPPPNKMQMVSGDGCKPGDIVGVVDHAYRGCDYDGSETQFS